MSEEKRECPHCKGDLSKYEDPLAVRMLNASTNELDALRAERDSERDSLAEQLSRERELTAETVQRLSAQLAEMKDILRMANTGLEIALEQRNGGDAILLNTRQQLAEAIKTIEGNEEMETHLNCELAEAKRQNGELSAAIAVKDAALQKVWKYGKPGFLEDGVCATCGWIDSHDPGCMQEMVAQALALKPADCLAPVREALREIFGSAQSNRTAKLAREALESIGDTQ